jgi:hypothetical protein
MRDVRGGVLWMEIKLDRKNSKKEKNGEDHPRTHSGSFYYEEKSPKTQKRQEKENPSLSREGKVKMAKINTNGVDN